ncbi:MAG: hypothetical protein O2816_12185, partial [Planctomycetota bacterium]|nr:hypothetical protein [Planctomycetota bacterium]
MRDLFTLLDPNWTGAICQTLPDGTGCTAVMGAAGVPSVSGGNFTLTLDDAPPTQPALLVYGTNPTKAQGRGGYLCVGSPKTRLGPWPTVGGGACGGRFSVDFSQLLTSGADPALQPGATVRAQFWYRDATGASGWS